MGSVAPERVYQTYLHEVETGGKRGALRRTAERYRKPDGSTYTGEWARLIVAAEEARRRPPDDATAYVPAPGELDYQAECRRMAATLSAPPADLPSPEPAGDDETARETASEAQEIMSPPRSTATAEPVDLPSPEPGPVDLPPVVVVKRVVVRPAPARPGIVAWAAEHEALRMQLFAYIAAAILILLCAA